MMVSKNDPTIFSIYCWVTSHYKKLKWGTYAVLHVNTVLISIPLALDSVEGKNPLPWNMAGMTSRLPQFNFPWFPQVPIY